MKSSSTKTRNTVTVILVAVIALILFYAFGDRLFHRKSVVITYDSNLSDKVAKTRRRSPATDEQYLAIGSGLRTLREELDKGDMEGSRKALQNVEKIVSGVPNESGLMKGIDSVDRAIKLGDPERARDDLDHLLQDPRLATTRRSG